MVNHLINRIIPFWNSLADYENGGFYGYVGYDLKIGKDYFKGAILHARILWFYSNCYLALGDEKCLEMAKHCYDFMVRCFYDGEYGGIYWSVTAKGEPLDTDKHGFCNAFFIYALASYYDASGDSGALKLAVATDDTIQRKMAERTGAYDASYRERCDREWNALVNVKPSDNGILAQKTMNTILHLIEAYTELYRVLNKPERDKEKSDKHTFISSHFKIDVTLENLLELTYNRLYDKENRRLSGYFDNDMNVIGDVHSYGHDIEAAWIIGRAVDAAESELSGELCGKIRKMNRALADRVNETAFDKSGAVYYERVNGAVDKHRAWWAQAEAAIGFYDAYNRYGEKKYLDRAESLWAYIQEHFIDRREGGEWFNELDENDNPIEMPIVNEWKCPYHNGRMCLHEYLFNNFR